MKVCFALLGLLLLILAGCGSSGPSASISVHSHREFTRFGGPPPGNPAAGDILVASSGRWSGSPTGFAYAWKDCDSSGANCATAAGSPTNTSRYVIVSGDAGSTLRVAVTASFSGHPDSTVLSQPTGVVSGGSMSAPTNTAGPYFAAPTGTYATCSNGCAVQGQTLTATTGTWTCSGGCGTLTYAYQWKDCTTSGSNTPTTGSCSNVASGGTSASYTVQASDVGSALVPIVTASNDGTAGTPTTVSGSCNAGWLPHSSPITVDVPTSNIAGCSPISAVVGATQGTEKFCTSSPTTCGFPDPLTGDVGVPPSQSLTTISSLTLHSTGCNGLGNPAYCSPSGSTSCSSGTPCVITGVNVTGGGLIDGPWWTIQDSVFQGSNPANQIINIRTGASHTHFSYVTFKGASYTGTNAFASFYDQGADPNLVADHIMTDHVERMTYGFAGLTLTNSFCMQNVQVTGAHYECMYDNGAPLTATGNFMMVAHNQSADINTDAGANATTMTYNLLVNYWDGSQSPAAIDCNGTSNVLTNNRIAIQWWGGASGPWHACTGTISNNVRDDTLAAENS